MDYASAAGGTGGEKLRDSLTLSKESKKTGSRRKSIDNDKAPPIIRRGRSAVQFSSSTVERDSKRVLTQVMGEDSDDEVSGGDANTSVRSIGSASSGGSALKKESKYSGGGGGEDHPKRHRLMYQGMTVIMMKKTMPPILNQHGASLIYDHHFN